MAPSKLQKLQKLLSGTFSATLPAAFDGLSLLCHGSSRGPTSCFCWASKLLSGTSEAPQAVSIGFRNCYLARFQHPLKASKPSKPSQQPSTAFRCFARTSRGPTSCFCWSSKLLSDTSEAPQDVSIWLRNCYLARFQHPLKASKPSQQLSTAFAALPWVLPRPHELFLLGFENVIWHFRGATSCFYWASKLLSGTLQLSTAIRCFAMGPPEAPQAVSVGLRNCYLARFQHPLKASKPSKPSKPSQQLSTAFAALPWVLPRPHELFLLGFETAIWHFRSATSCFYWASKLLSGTFSAPLKSLKTLPAAFDGLRCFTMVPPEAPRAVSVGLRNCYLALPKRHKMFLLGFETAIWHVFSTP